VNWIEPPVKTNPDSDRQPRSIGYSERYQPHPVHRVDSTPERMIAQETPGVLNRARATTSLKAGENAGRDCPRSIWTRYAAVRGAGWVQRPTAQNPNWPPSYATGLLVPRYRKCIETTCHCATKDVQGAAFLIADSSRIRQTVWTPLCAPGVGHFARATSPWVGKNFAVPAESRAGRRRSARE